MIFQSMWAINNMFGTGTRGFAIITTTVSCGTYAIVITLLHAPPLPVILTSLKKHLLWETLHKWIEKALNLVGSILKQRPMLGSSQKGSQVETAGADPGAQQSEATAKAEGATPIVRTAAASATMKEKEKRTEEEVLNASRESLAKGGTSLVTIFRRKKPLEQVGDMEKGDKA